MKEIRSIVEKYHNTVSQVQKMALATVVHVEDSSYRRSGARMLIAEDGTWTGGISGGCLEGDTLRRAQKVMYEGQPDTIRYDTRSGDRDQIGVGLGCNGLIDVLISPIIPGDHNQINVLRQVLDQRHPSVLITVVAGPSTAMIGHLIIYSVASDLQHLHLSAPLEEKVDRAVKEVLQRERSQKVSMSDDSSSWTLFVEYIPPDIHLLIFGKNYDVYPLASIARQIGWKVTIIANPLKVSHALYGLAHTVVSGQPDLPSCDRHCAALLMSHDYATDASHLHRLVSTPVKYIGLLGPRSRGQKLIYSLEKAGLSYDEDIIHAPIGLDTGATTPEEIAISMIAEIRAHFSGRSGGHLRDRTSKIND